eukprot:3045220-Lingulodinium_polyedra.AAC.1
MLVARNGDADAEGEQRLTGGCQALGHYGQKGKVGERVAGHSAVVGAESPFVSSDHEPGGADELGEEGRGSVPLGLVRAG